jgi:Protein of unknown function (DUF1343).
VITERYAFESVRVGLAIACELRRLHEKEWKVDDYGRLLGNAATLAAIKAGRNPGDITPLWANDLQEFQIRREKALLYPHTPLPAY